MEPYPLLGMIAEDLLKALVVLCEERFGGHSRVEILYLNGKVSSFCSYDECGDETGVVSLPKFDQR